MMKLMSPIALLSLATLGACASTSGTAASTAASAASTAAIASAEELLAAMRARYDGRWYRSLTFVQASTFYKPDGTIDRVETWREAGLMPGRLRIDTDTARGRGVIYANDSLYVFDGGKLVRTLSRQNELMVLGFDVYHLTPAQSAAKLRALGFDLAKFRRALHDGREYFVVGAGAGEPSARQFWIEADRLLFWRVIMPGTRPGTRVSEIRFQKYVPHGGGWVGEEVDFLVDGRRDFFEGYSEVKTDLPVDPAIFEPAKYAETAGWWRK